MSYAYEVEKRFVFTDEGQRQFLRIRDRVNNHLRVAGACSMSAAIAGESGSSWEMMACVDRLIELGELREITGPNVAGQHRVFVGTKR